MDLYYHFLNWITKKLNEHLKIVLLFKICSKIIVLQQHDATVAPDIFGILKL